MSDFLFVGVGLERGNVMIKRTILIMEKYIVKQ